MTAAPEISRAIRALRKRAGQSQQTFSTLLGLSISALQKYENDEALPEPRALLRFAALARDGGLYGLEELFGKAAVLFLSMPGWKVEIRLEKCDSPPDQKAFPDIRWRSGKAAKRTRS